MPGINQGFLKHYLVFLLCLFVTSGVAAQLAPIPPLSAPVVDTTTTLTAGQQEQLNEQALALSRDKGSQLQVLIVPSTKPEDIAAYAQRVFDQWKLGRKGVDDGVLLVVAVKDRTLRIQTGYGLEGAIPDATAKRIIQEDIVPKFRANDYAGGIIAGTERLKRLIEGEALPPPYEPPQRTEHASSERLYPDRPPSYEPAQRIEHEGNDSSSWIFFFFMAAMMEFLLGWLFFVISKNSRKRERAKFFDKKQKELLETGHKKMSEKGMTHRGSKPKLFHRFIIESDFDESESQLFRRFLVESELELLRRLCRVHILIGAAFVLSLFFFLLSQDIAEIGVYAGSFLVLFFLQFIAEILVLIHVFPSDTPPGGGSSGGGDSYSDYSSSSSYSSSYDSSSSSDSWSGGGGSSGGGGASGSW